jgi:hypothetical protein
MSILTRLLGGIMAAVDITILRNRVKALETAKTADEAKITALEARPVPVDTSAAIAALTTRVAAIETELANPS